VNTLDEGPFRGLDELVAPLAALLVVLTLARCAQGVTDNRSYAPYAPENNGSVPEHGGGDGGGGGGGGM
jgi:hypothetical protein